MDSPKLAKNTKIGKGSDKQLLSQELAQRVDNPSTVRFREPLASVDQTQPVDIEIQDLKENQKIQQELLQALKRLSRIIQNCPDLESSAEMLRQITNFKPKITDKNAEEDFEVIRVETLSKAKQQLGHLANIRQWVKNSEATISAAMKVCTNLTNYFQTTFRDWHIAGYAGTIEEEPTIEIQNVKNFLETQKQSNKKHKTKGTHDIIHTTRLELKDFTEANYASYTSMNLKIKVRQFLGILAQIDTLLDSNTMSNNDKHKELQQLIKNQLNPNLPVINKFINDVHPNEEVQHLNSALDIPIIKKVDEYFTTAKSKPSKNKQRALKSKKLEFKDLKTEYEKALKSKNAYKINNENKINKSIDSIDDKLDFIRHKTINIILPYTKEVFEAATLIGSHDDKLFDNAKIEIALDLNKKIDATEHTIYLRQEEIDQLERLKSQSEEAPSWNEKLGQSMISASKRLTEMASSKVDSSSSSIEESDKSIEESNEKILMKKISEFLSRNSQKYRKEELIDIAKTYLKICQQDYLEKYNIQSTSDYAIEAASTILDIGIIKEKRESAIKAAVFLKEKYGLTLKNIKINTKKGFIIENSSASTSFTLDRFGNLISSDRKKQRVYVIAEKTKKTDELTSNHPKEKTYILMIKSKHNPYDQTKPSFCGGLPQLGGGSIGADDLIGDQSVTINAASREVREELTEYQIEKGSETHSRSISLSYDVIHIYQAKLEITQTNPIQDQPAAYRESEALLEVDMNEFIPWFMQRDSTKQHGAILSSHTFNTFKAPSEEHFKKAFKKALAQWAHEKLPNIVEEPPARDLGWEENGPVGKTQWRDFYRSSTAIDSFADFILASYQAKKEH